MSDAWAVSIPLARGSDAARLWRERGVTVGIDGDRLWLRGDAWSEELDRACRGLLGAERFQLRDDGQRVPWGRMLPTGQLPAGMWTPLREWLELAPPLRGLAAGRPAPMSLQLVRSEVELPANVLLVPLAAWVAYAQRAPLVRLSRWSFAVSDDGAALVRGAPIPPLAGEHYIETAGVAVRAGWRCDPPLGVQVVRSSLHLQGDDLALVSPDGMVDVIAGDEFVQATRSAVRLTAEAAAP